MCVCTDVCVCVCVCVESDLLKLCDTVRDVELPELGVILEDKEGHTVVKVVGKEAALREREALLEVTARTHTHTHTHTHTDAVPETNRLRHSLLLVRAPAGIRLLPQYGRHAQRREASQRHDRPSEQEGVFNQCVKF